MREWERENGGGTERGRGHSVFAFKASAQNRVLKFLALVCYQQRLLVCVGLCASVCVYVCPALPALSSCQLHAGQSQHEHEASKGCLSLVPLHPLTFGKFRCIKRSCPEQGRGQHLPPNPHLALA